jgi:hypothetical protein
MKYIILFLATMVLALNSNAQVESLISHKYVNSSYTDNFNTFEHYNIFHSQSLVNFHLSEGHALSSYLSNTSKAVHQNFVLGDSFNEVVSNHFQTSDTSQTWIDLIFILRFSYKNQNMSIVRYQIVNNGIVTKPTFDRLIYKIENGRIAHYIDRTKEDEFITVLTKVVGLMDTSILRVLLGIDKPRNNSEKELLELVTSKDNCLQLNSIVELFNNGDQNLRQFLDM